jgi:hypothetical protein
LPQEINASGEAHPNEEEGADPNGQLGPSLLFGHTQFGGIRTRHSGDPFVKRERQTIPINIKK